MFTAHSAKQLPRTLAPDLKKAIEVAFLTLRTEASDGDGTAPTMLLRLVRRRGAERLGVSMKHLNDLGGDAVRAIDNFKPERLLNRQPGDQHIGAIAVADFIRYTGGDGEEPSATGRGRLLAGVMVTNWSFEMYRPEPGEQPTCTIASPLEFGQVGSGLAPAVAALNERFRMVQSPSVTQPG